LAFLRVAGGANLVPPGGPGYHASGVVDPHLGGRRGAAYPRPAPPPQGTPAGA
jgi:hypothetical protein